jgi:hypothetical protein
MMSHGSGEHLSWNRSNEYANGEYIFTQVTLTCTVCPALFTGTKRQSYWEEEPDRSIAERIGMAYVNVHHPVLITADP